MHPIANEPLSPSRIAQFESCQLAFRYKYIEKLPQKPGAAAFRGNLIHSVLEAVLALPSPDRTLDAALSRISSTYDELIAREPERRFAVLDGAGWPNNLVEPTAQDIGKFQTEAAALIEVYFKLEDPKLVEVVEIELYAKGELADGTVIHGYVDRLDMSHSGVLTVTDYKTGKAPAPAYRDKYWRQLRIYALLLTQSGQLVKRLQLHFLGGQSQTIEYFVDDDDLASLGHELAFTVRRLRKAAETLDFQPKTSPLCNFCDFQALCPAKGGSALPWPA